MSKFTTRPEIVGNFGVVTSTHWIASAIGMSILEKNGNAFDCLLYTSPSPRDKRQSRMPSSA